MTRETFIDGNKTILDTNFYLYLLQCENNQNKLISFLEDKIKECNKSIGTDLLKTNATHSSKIVEVSAYQEVLDFVEKGGKE